MAGSASKKKVTFTRTELRTLLTEFQAAKKKNPNFDTILPRSKAMQVQAALQRVSSLAQGGDLPPATARSLSAVLFPPQAPKAPPQPETPATSPSGEAASEENAYYEEEASAGAAEIYIDPDTGQEVYWDGSPVYAEDGSVMAPPAESYQDTYYEEAPAEGEEYYEEGAMEEEYYEEEGGEYTEESEVYYDENGQPYYEEETTEEEGSY
jgi:hypothetical protein